MNARTAASPRQSALLSFDVEEFDLPVEYGRAISLDEQIRVGSEGLERVLDLLARRGVPATLFTTAVFAEARVDLVRRAVSEGHEIASHGWSHSSWDDQDAAKSRGALERIADVPVRGFRMARMAPIGADVLADAGYAYNSSEHPTWIPGRYNNLARPRRPFLSAGGRIVNIPASVSPAVRIPLFWLSFKNMPPVLYRGVVRWTLGADGDANFYFHPWEFADLGGYGLGPLSTGVNGRALVDRLDRFLVWMGRRAEWTTFGTYAERWRRRHAGGDA
jgi:hypothetical protein